MSLAKGASVKETIWVCVRLVLVNGRHITCSKVSPGSQARRLEELQKKLCLNVTVKCMQKIINNNNDDSLIYFTLSAV